MAESFKAVRPGRTLADLNRDAAAAHDYSGKDSPQPVKEAVGSSRLIGGSTKKKVKKGKDEKDVRHSSSGGQQVTRSGAVVAEHDSDDHWFEHTPKIGESRPHTLSEGAGVHGGQWKTKSPGPKPEVAIHNSRKEAEEHIERSQRED